MSHSLFQYLSLAFPLYISSFHSIMTHGKCCFCSAHDTKSTMMLLDCDFKWISSDNTLEHTQSLGELALKAWKCLDIYSCNHHVCQQRWYARLTSLHHLHRITKGKQYRCHTCLKKIYAFYLTHNIGCLCVCMSVFCTVSLSIYKYIHTLLKYDMWAHFAVTLCIRTWCLHTSCEFCVNEFIVNYLVVCTTMFEIASMWAFYLALMLLLLQPLLLHLNGIYSNGTNATYLM